MQGLYFGGRRVAGIRTIVAESTVVVEYSYDPTLNPVASIQSIVERLKPYVLATDLDTYKETQATEIANIKATAQGQATEIANIKATAQGQATEIARLGESKQNNLSFDETYNAETNKVATVQTVVRLLSEIVANAPEGLNTLAELAAWITAHPEDVAAINASIQAQAAAIAENKQAIAALVRCGTEDLTAGVSELPKGCVYFVYE